MATSRNDITGDALKSRSANEAFRKGWETTFGKKDTEPPKETKLPEQTDQSDTESK